MDVARRDLAAAGLLVVSAEVQAAGHAVSMVIGLVYLAVAVVSIYPPAALLLVAAGLCADAAAGGVLITGYAAVLALAWLGFRLGGGRLRSIWSLTGGLGAIALASVADQVAAPGSFAPADDVVFYSAVLGLPALAGWLLADRSAQLGQLRRRSAELQRRREGLVHAARVREAERVGRAVHGAMAQRLRAIIDGIERARTLATANPDLVPAELARVEGMARAALGELRAVLGVLRPADVAAAPEPRAVPPVRVVTARHPAFDRLDAALLASLVPLGIETALSPHHSPVALNLLAVSAQATALVGVRRRPLVAAPALLAVAALQTAFLAPLPATVSWLFPGVLVTFLVGRQLPVRRAWAGFASVAVGVAAVIGVTPAPDRALDGVLPDAVIAVVAFWVGRTVRARESRVGALAAMAAELARRNDHEVNLAAVEQRAEMARELHDLGAHMLTVVCLQCGAGQATWNRDRPAALGAVLVLSELASDALTHLRTSLTGLADIADDDVGAAMNTASLDVLAGLGRVLGLDVIVTVHGAPQPMPGDVARAAFRVVQESLTNAARHAAHTRVEIGLSWDIGHLEVLVTDTGPAATDHAPVAITGSGSGLRGMRERVEACRGELASGPHSGGGFTVIARLPLVVGA